ncbi:MAG TPA: hypothetical protein EYH34_08340 [Planctomycetes bacterium]|nr:hypothetical protein [Planctomycetota bacterium]
MELVEQLRGRQEAIARRWLEDTLATYAAETARRLDRDQDRFTNPVGYALRTGTQAVVAGLLEGRTAEVLSGCLDEIIRIRAVQEFAPSQAVGFVFRLREVIRAEVQGDSTLRPLASGLGELEERIERLGLLAFDLYMKYRQRIFELRVNEMKRSVAKVIERMNRFRPGAEGGGLEDPGTDGPSERGSG